MRDYVGLMMTVVIVGVSFGLIAYGLFDSVRTACVSAGIGMLLVKVENTRGG